MARVFLSYRRNETQDLVYRLRDHLLPHCDDVFVDVHSIPPGENFRAVLEAAVTASDVVLAVLGQTWISGGTSGTSIKDPADYVRVELETAKKNDVVVIPLLVHGAAMPTVDSLPASLAFLPALQAIEIGSPAAFDHHVDLIIARINEVGDVYIRRTIKGHAQRTSGLGKLKVKMVTKDGALITSQDGRGFQVHPDHREYVGDWQAADEYAVVLAIANLSRGALAVATEILTLDAREFDTDDPAVFEKISRLQREPRES